MNIDKRRRKLIELLKDKDYRNAFISESIDTAIPFQIQALREQRGWSQEKLGSQIEGKKMPQAEVSRLENNYSKFTLSTLKRLAVAFKVGLMVRFVPLSDLVEWELNLSNESLKAIEYDKDPYFQDTTDQEHVTDMKPEEHKPSLYLVGQEKKSKDIFQRSDIAINQQKEAIQNPFKKPDRPLQGRMVSGGSL